MDEKALQEIFHEFISSLEALDTRSSAISQFLKDKGIATEEALSGAGGKRQRRAMAGHPREDRLFVFYGFQTGREHQASRRRQAGRAYCA